MSKQIHICFLTFCFSGMFSLACAQSQYEDSVIAILNGSVADSTAVRLNAILSEICEEDQIETYAGKANQLAEIVLRRLSPGNFYRKDILKHQANALNNLGYITTAKGDLSRALGYYLKGLSISEELNDAKIMAKSLNNIAVNYLQMNDHAQAVEYFNRSVQCWKKIGDRESLVITLNSIANVYLKEGKDSLAIVCLNQSLLASGTGFDPQGLAGLYSSLGVAYSKGDTARAGSYFRRSIAMFDSLQNEHVCDPLLAYGNMCMKKNANSSAERLAKQAFVLALEKRYVYAAKEASFLLYNIYKNTGKGMDALENYREYIKFRDSLEKEQNRRSAYKQNLQYEYDKKQTLLLAEREKDKGLAEAERKRAILINLFIGSVAFCAAAGALVVTRSLRITRRQKKIIEEQKVLVEEKQKNIVDSINYAERIQSALLAGDEVWKRISKEYFILFKPKDIVSGDFYWAHLLPNGRAVFVLADCTGHGVPGGFMSMLGISFLNEIVVESKIFNAAEILNRMRTKVIKALEQKGDEARRDGMDAAVCVWNKLNNTIEFAGANNGLVLVIGGEVVEIPGNKMPIGRHTANDKPFESVSFEVHQGDAIYLYTDGYADQFGGPKGKKFKYKKLNELLAANCSKPAGEQKQILEKTLEEWRRNLEQVDDVSVLGIKI